jgi:hypothetical protein
MYAEKINSECDDANSGLRLCRDEESEAATMRSATLDLASGDERNQQEERHHGKSGQKQIAATKLVDRKDGRQSKDAVQ